MNHLHHVHTRRVTLKSLALATLIAWSALAGAQTADKTLRIVVPYPPGGTTDLLARNLAPGLQQRTGLTVVIENKAGAGGVIGSQQVSKAAPDGRTLVMGTIASHGIIPALQSPPPYDPTKDFVPVTLVASTPNVLLASPTFPAKDVKELIALAKAKPGSINFGSTSHGGSPHMSGELLKTLAQIDIAHIPYKGGAPMLSDLMGGQVQIGFDNLPSSMSLIKAGKVRALAVTTNTRWPAAPDIPTLAEAGVPGYEMSAWFGLFAPAGTPKPLVDDLNKHIVAILKTPEMQQKMLELGAQPVGDSPEQFAAYVRSDNKKWQEVGKANNIKLN
ncbi:Bug family tripartite tricarboxylate transporter substrate binding protein [Zwartia panacis]|uniref:Bug family tripartite tricarboxylate transporter substrate binding protein n=1 Tax=Zwartia panacis TaxID=2683345 RepID=UPI0025B4B48F|nr:tripartite tricarboxylate transporter substrate binding protein [Zwartia panacis]MDN4016114.1 tripartite tricarboxylate transporter substrate binding protein [Zwartia panacis]